MIKDTPLSDAEISEKIAALETTTGNRVYCLQAVKLDRNDKVAGFAYAYLKKPSRAVMRTANNMILNGDSMGATDNVYKSCYIAAESDPEVLADDDFWASIQGSLLDTLNVGRGELKKN